MRENQARNQLETPGMAKSFLRGAQIFQTMSNSFQLRPADLSRGGRKGLQGASPPLVTGLAKTNTSCKRVRELLCADDPAVVAHSGRTCFKIFAIVFLRPGLTLA